MALTRPLIDPPEGSSPEELTIDDLIVGEGEEFDASWNRGDPFRFGLGAGQVISGWDQGVQGMKVGGRRRLTIPSHLGYGAAGAGGVIKPNETLIFVVDLLEVL